MMNFLKILGFVLVIVLFTSCIVKNTEKGFYLKSNKSFSKYSVIEDVDYAIMVDIFDTLLDVTIFTSESQNCFVKERGVKIIEKKVELQFADTKDSLQLIDFKKNTHSCVNFKDKITQNKRLNLNFTYTIDSAGVKNKYNKNFILHKKKYTHYSLRVH